MRRTNKLGRYRRLLIAKRLELSNGRSGPLHSMPAVDAEGDELDRATTQSEATVQDRLQQMQGQMWRAIEEALGRIACGTYGLCAACRHRIPGVRLKAVPWTKYCLHCTEQLQT